MKCIAFILVLFFVFCVSRDVNAQRPVQRRNNYGAPAQQTPQRNNYGNPDTTINSNAPSNYGNSAQNAGMAIDTSLPITVIQSI